MKAYSSNREFLNDLVTIAEMLDVAGFCDAANDVRSGLRCFNGLNDGWFLLKESLDQAATRIAGVILPNDLASDFANAVETVNHVLKSE